MLGGCRDVNCRGLHPFFLKKRPYRSYGITFFDISVVYGRFYKCRQGVRGVNTKQGGSRIIYILRYNIKIIMFYPLHPLTLLLYITIIVKIE